MSTANLIVKPDGSLQYLTEPAHRLEVSSLADTLRDEILSRPRPRLISAAAAKPRRSALAAQAQQGSLAVEIPPPPPPPETEIPEEYFVFDLEANRRPVTLKDELADADGGGGGGGSDLLARYRIFPSTRPSSRSEVHLLAQVLERMLRQAGPRTSEALRAWDLAFSELVRQVFVACVDRGELLGRVRRAYDHYLAALIDRVRYMEGTEREVELRRLEAENGELKKRLGETQTAARSSKVMGLFRAAAAEGRGSRMAIEATEIKQSNEKAKAGSPSEVCLRAYNGCPPAEQAGVWKDMLSAATGKARVGLLYQLWKMFGESKRPELLRNLTAELPVEAQTAYALAVATKLSYEERVGVVERLMRQFSAYEMSSFLDFLPYVWEDLSVQFTSKLLSKMTVSDRTRIATQLAKEVELAAAKAAADQGSDDAVAAVVAAADRADKASAALDPSGLFPNELPGWVALSPASSQTPAYDLSHALALSVECLELALSDYADEHHSASASAGSGGSGGTSALLASRLGARRAVVSQTPPWPRTVFNVLLRRVPAPKDNQQKIASGSATTISAAREALWTYISSLRSHAKQSARAKLFARLCGLTKYELSERRVELVIKLLAQLTVAEQRRLLQEMARPDGDGVAAAYLPMDRAEPADGAPPPPPALPALLHSVEAELGGGHKVSTLVQKLNTQAIADPRPASAATPACVRVVDADVALLFIVDAFDAARLKLLGQLAALHEQLEVQRASGALDAPAFVAALRNFDQTLSEGGAMAIYVDCELAAAEERARELAAARERAGAAGAAVVPAVVHQSAVPSDSVPRAIFLRVCEEHQAVKTEAGSFRR